MAGHELPRPERQRKPVDGADRDKRRQCSDLLTRSARVVAEPVVNIQSIVVPSGFLTEQLPEYVGGAGDLARTVPAPGRRLSRATLDATP